MASNQNSKDLRIEELEKRVAELEGQLKAANAKTQEAEAKAADRGAVVAQVQELEMELEKERGASKALAAQVEELRNGAATEKRPTIKGLPSGAFQLSESVVCTNAKSKARAYPQAGAVVCSLKTLDETEKAVGTRAKVVPVSDDELAALRKAKRVY